MKENTQEKNLVEKNEKSFFGKIKSFFKNLFGRKQVEEKEEVSVSEVSTENETNNEFMDYIKITEDEETQLLDLQRRYRKGEIAGNDLTEEQIDALCNLYDKQIADLKIAIENTKKQIEECDQKIQKKNA